MNEVKIGNVLKELREEKGYKQSYVAAKIGISTSAISKHENNIDSPSYDVLVKLADLYSVSLDTIFSRNVVISTDNAEEYCIRTSTKLYQLITLLQKNEYMDLLNYILEDPEQRLKLILSRMRDYI